MKSTTSRLKPAPVSLHPLSPERVLDALLKTPPQKKDHKLKARKARAKLRLRQPI